MYIMRGHYDEGTLMFMMRGHYDVRTLSYLPHVKEL